MKTRRSAAVGLFAAAVLLFFPRTGVKAEADAERVVVVGGGLAGLTAAYELQKLGITAHVLEAADRFGGRVATADYGGGLRAEYGVHEIWEKNPLLDYVREFDIPLEKPGKPYSSVYLDGRLYPYVQDSEAEYFSTLFSPREKAEYDRWLREVEKLYDKLEGGGLTAEPARLQKISFKEWVDAFRLPRKVAGVIRLGLECEIAADWADISAAYGIQQCAIFLHGTERSYHAQGGNAQIIKALAAAIKGPKTLGAQVVRIARSRRTSGKTEALVYYRKDNVVRSVTAEKVILALPYHLLHAVQMEPGLTDEQWQAVETLVPGRYLAVHFVLDTEANGIILVGGKNPFPVLTRGPLGVVYGFHGLPAPGQKEEIFSLLIYGRHTRTYLEPQDRIRARLLAELDKIWPGFSKHVRAAYFYNYHPAATPAWPPGRSPADSLSASLRRENVGLYLAGDYIHTSHSEGAVISGRDAAREAAAALASP